MVNRGFVKRALAAFLISCLAVVGSFAISNPAQASLTYYFAGANQTYSTTAVAANSAPGAPTISSGDFHSLFEIALESADQQQVVEVFWSVDPGLYGDNNPHFGVGRWTNGTFGGYNDASWNDYTPNTTINRGSSLASYVGGAEKTFGIQYQSTGTTGWWISFDGSFVGWFSDGLWTSPTFTTSGFIQLFGEAAVNTSTPCTMMGNGIFPNGTTYPTAGAPLRWSNTTYANGTGSVNLAKFTSTNSSYYDAAPQPAGSVRSFAIGGRKSGC